MSDIRIDLYLSGEKRGGVFVKRSDAERVAEIIAEALLDARVELRISAFTKPETVANAKSESARHVAGLDARCGYDRQAEPGRVAGRRRTLVELSGGGGGIVVA